MKKIKMITSLLLCISVLLCACGTKKLEGRPSAVVDQAQDLKEGETATVEVTGFVSEAMVFIYLTDAEGDWYLDADYVQCEFKDASALDGIEEGDRLTITGELTANNLYIESGRIWIVNCEIK